MQVKKGAKSGPWQVTRIRKGADRADRAERRTVTLAAGGTARRQEIEQASGTARREEINWAAQ